jgi:PAS domain-containing protein
VRGVYIQMILELARDRATNTLDYCLEEADHILANAQNLPSTFPHMEYCHDQDHFCLLVDYDGRIIYANQVAGILFERPADRLVGRCLYALGPRERMEPRKNIIESVVKMGKTYEYIDLDGTGQWFDTWFIPLRTNGQVCQVVICAMALEQAPEPLAVRVVE